MAQGYRLLRGPQSLYILATKITYVGITRPQAISSSGTLARSRVHPV